MILVNGINDRISVIYLSNCKTIPHELCMSMAV